MGRPSEVLNSLYLPQPDWSSCSPLGHWDPLHVELAARGHGVNLTKSIQKEAQTLLMIWDSMKEEPPPAD